jgi:FkbM family methyltransferase
MTAIRDFFRRRRVARHVARHGHIYPFHGLTVTLPAHVETGAASALLRGKYEQEEAEFIERFLPAELPVIELGGSLGVVSRLIRSRLSPGVRHIVVEANGALLETLATNSRVAASDPTEIVHAALAYGTNEVTFETGAGVHANRIASADARGQTVRVSAVTLADLWNRLGQPTAYSLVCDIEGAERDLFRNDAETLRHAQVVIVETHPAFYPAGSADTAALHAAASAIGLNLIAQRNNVDVFRRNL